MFHMAIIFLMLAAVGAFLILWYLWVRRRLDNSFFLDDEEHVLFPFRYFSWILIGVVVMTSLVQIHFLRVSSVVHERLASLTYSLRDQKVSASDIDELKRMIEVLRGELDPRTRPVTAGNVDWRGDPESSGSVKEPNPANGRMAREDALASLPAAERDTMGAGFAQEAKAFRNEEASPPKTERTSRSPGDGDRGYSMRLNLWGRVRTEALRVRNRPTGEGVVMEKLRVGEEVKVTEKRIIDDRMWYRVITPSGRAGWVDFRYLELRATASPATGG